MSTTRSETPACPQCGRTLDVIRLRMPLRDPSELITFECRPCALSLPGPRMFEAGVTPR